MPRGQSQVTKMFYKGQEEDFIVFVEDPEALEKWKTDKSIPLVEVVDSFKVFVTHKQGAQGNYDGASKSTLQNEFGTSNEDEVIAKILQNGSLQRGESNPNHPGRGGDRNETQGPRQAH